MVQRFNQYFIFCLDIAPAETHGIAPKEDYSYSEGYVCFEYCICWQVWGCCNYFESSSIFCRNCVVSKWPWRRSAWSRRSEDLNGKFISAISFDEGFNLCSHVTNYVLCCLRMWRTSFVLFSTIFMLFYSYIWWTSCQYEGFGLETCVKWHLDEDTQHLAMSKKAQAHSAQLSYQTARTNTVGANINEGKGKAAVSPVRALQHRMSRLQHPLSISCVLFNVQSPNDSIIFVLWATSKFFKRLCNRSCDCPCLTDKHVSIVDTLTFHGSERASFLQKNKKSLLFALWVLQRTGSFSCETAWSWSLRNVVVDSTFGSIRKSFQVLAVWWDKWIMFLESKLFWSRASTQVTQVTSVSRCSMVFWVRRVRNG